MFHLDSSDEFHLIFHPEVDLFKMQLDDELVASKPGVL